MIQASTRGQVLAGVQQHGVAPGARAMMDMEDEAAASAIESGLYVTWRSRNGTDCTRVGARSKCFCGHAYGDHAFATKRSPYPTCRACTCRAFAFIPQRYAAPNPKLQYYCRPGFVRMRTDACMHGLWEA